MSNRTYNNVTVDRTAKTDTLESVYNATINTVANSLRSNATYAENTQATTASTDNVFVANLSISSLTLPSATISTITQSDISFQNVTISNISTTNLTVTNLNILDNVYLANGSANAPSLSFINDTNTGLYLNNTNELSISCSGTETLRVTNNNIISKENIYLPNGTEAAPAIDNGVPGTAGIFYNSGQQSLDFTFADNSRVLLSQDGLVMDTVDGTRILNSDGSEAAPSYTFINDTNTGFYTTGGSLAFSTGGSTRLILNNSSTTFRERVFQNISGSSGFLALDNNVQPKLSDQIVRNNISVLRSASNISGTYNISDIAYNPLLNIYVATVSNGNFTLYSNDGGISWNSTTMPNGAANIIWGAVVYADHLKLLVATGSSRFATSTDGVNWTVDSAKLFGLVPFIRYFKELNRIYGGKINNANNNPIIYSSDSINWARIGSNTTATIRDIAYSPSWNMILYCSDILARYYYNDINNIDSFTTYTSNISITSLDWSPKLQLFAAVVNSVNNGLVYINNTNQRPPVWSLVSTINAGTTNAFSRIRWIDHLNAFIIISNGTNPFYYSYDAINWTALSGGLTNLTRTTIFSDSVNGSIFYGGTSGTNNQRITFTNFNSRLITQQTLNNSNINSINSDGKETFKYGISTNTGNIYELQFSNGLPGNGSFPINPSNSYIITNSAFNNLAGGVLANDGNIYIVGKSDKKVIKLDPKTDTVSVNNFNYIGDFNGAVLSPNGKIYCIPSTTNFIGIYDPVSNILDTTTMSGTDLNNIYLSGVLARNGYIYCPPSDNNISKTLIINTFSNTYNILSNNSLTANGKGVLGQDGNVYFCSDVSIPTQRGVKLDLSTSFTSPTITQFTTGRNFLYNGCLGPNINGSHTIYYVGGGATNMYKLEYPYTGPATNVGVTLPYDFYNCCTLGQDGLIYLIPDKDIANATISVLNPLNNTLLNTNISSTFTRNEWSFSILAPNGKIYCFPKQNGFNTVLVITPAVAGISNVANLPPNQSTWVLGPSFNKT